MGMGFSSRKSQEMPGAHKIGAANSGPRITGGNYMDMRIFLTNEGGDATESWLSRITMPLEMIT